MAMKRLLFQVVTSMLPVPPWAGGEIYANHYNKSVGKVKEGIPSKKGDALSCGLARPHGFIGGKPIQVTASHGPGIEPCRCSGNTVLDA